jgi:hypothetical protein
MKMKIIRCTEDCLPLITSPRFYRNERGYAAELNRLIRPRLEQSGLMISGRITEIEAQKRRKVHKTRQRPDLILHIPVETSGAMPNMNNVVVWAFKVNATKSEAKSDFKKLDEMFSHLHYPLGFFVNIAGTEDMLEEYNGNFNERLVGVAVRLENGIVEYSIRRCIFV